MSSVAKVRYERMPAILKNPNSEAGQKSYFNPLKKVISVIGTFTDSPTAYGSVIRQINECILPLFAQISLKCMKFSSALSSLLSRAVSAIDLGEIFNSANYLVNDGLAKDLSRDRYFSIAGQSLLLPVCIIEVALFIKDAGVSSFSTVTKFATTLGQWRAFSFAPSVANFIGKIPVLGAIPLNGAAQALSNWRPLGFVPYVSLGSFCTGAVCGAYAFFGVQAAKNYMTYGDKIKFYKDELTGALVHESHLYKRYENAKENINEKINLKDDLNKTIPVVDNAMCFASNAKIAKLKVKIQNNENKQFQSALDVNESVAKLAWKGATVAAGLTSGPIFGAVGVYALGSIGYSLYNRMTTSKPTLQSALNF